MERIKKIIASLICCLSLGCASNYVNVYTPGNACEHTRMYSALESFEFYKGNKRIKDYRLNAYTQDYLHLYAKSIEPENCNKDELLLKLCEEADANKDDIVSLIEARKKYKLVSGQIDRQG